MRWLYIVAPVLVVLAGCGNDSKSSSSSGSAGETQVTFAAGATASDVAPASPAATDAVVASSPQLVVKADLSVEADDVGATADRAMQANAALGGSTFSSSIDLGDRPKASLTLKVLPANLTAFVDSVKKFGRLTAQSQDTEDVTNQIIDLDVGSPPRGRASTACASSCRRRRPCRRRPPRRPR